MNRGWARFFLTVFLLGFVMVWTTTARAASASPSHRRCAFDIGSGETKLSAAEVVIAGPKPTMTKLLAKRILLPFAKSLEGRMIPDWLIEEAIAKLNELRNQCDALGAREYSGVATSGFRMAQNAKHALARIIQGTKIPLRVITGEQEAVLAFLAAASALRFEAKNLVVWDIGGGSLQFSMSADHVIEAQPDYIISAGHEGAELFRREIAKQLNRGAEQTVNPLDQAEMNRAVALAKQWSQAVNPKIKEKLRRRDTRVVGLGGIHAESLVAQAGLRFKSPYKIYTIDGVRRAARRAINMSDQDFRNAYPKNQYPESQATNLALVLGYMENLHIEQVIPLQVTLADGLLVHQAYWDPK